MKQAFAGVAPPESGEATVMVVWPSIGANGFGRWVGRLAALEQGVGSFFTIGKLLALATIPISLAVFAWQLMPFVCRRYKLTNRRILIEKGLTSAEERSLELQEFDAIEVLVLPGQDWLHAGELVFKRDQTEVFRLSGVSRPETFRQTCLKVQTAFQSVGQVVKRQAALAAQ